MLRTSMGLRLLGRPEKKESTVKGDRCDPAKNFPIVKLVFSLGHKERIYSEWFKLTLCEWNLLLLQRVRRGSTCLDPLPSWVMSAVIKENGLHEALYMEFLPHIMQCVVFCLCESYGGFSVKFTKYYSLVHVYVIHKHIRPQRIPFMA